MFIQGNGGDGCRCSDEGTLNKETQEYIDEFENLQELKEVDATYTLHTRSMIGITTCDSCISFLQSQLSIFLNAQTPANNRFEVGTGTLAANNRIVFLSVRSIYAALVSNGVRVVSQEIWRAKLPTKIKIFMWYLKKRCYLN